MQTIDLKQLKEIEKIEFEELMCLVTEPEKNLIKPETISWKRGRWGMVRDLIEKLEKGE